MEVVKTTSPTAEDLRAEGRPLVDRAVVQDQVGRASHAPAPRILLNTAHIRR